MLFIDTDDEVPTESDDKSESDTRIKVPPPPPSPTRGKENRTSLLDANTGTLHPITLSMVGCLATSFEPN